jgi:hypothetical protein
MASVAGHPRWRGGYWRAVVANAGKQECKDPKALRIAEICTVGRARVRTTGRPALQIEVQLADLAEGLNVRDSIVAAMLQRRAQDHLANSPSLS